MAVNARGTRRQKRQRLEVKRRRDPCCICGQPIDYTLPADDPDAFTVEHLRPWSTHPELREDPANLAAAHRRCNSARGNRDDPGLGLQSRTW